MSTPVSALKQHIRLLLGRHKIEHRVISRKSPRLARANFADRAIYAPSVTDELSYAIALHEIGHFVVTSRQGTLLDEAAVWSWVRSTALIWPALFDELVAHCLTVYARQTFIRPRITNHFK
jgi:hypothetical protein